MFCRYCGESQPDDSNFCARCGKATATPPPGTSSARSGDSPKAAAPEPAAARLAQAHSAAGSAEFQSASTGFSILAYTSIASLAWLLVTLILTLMPNTAVWLETRQGEVFTAAGEIALAVVALVSYEYLRRGPSKLVGLAYAASVFTTLAIIAAFRTGTTADVVYSVASLIATILTLAYLIRLSRSIETPSLATQAYWFAAFLLLAIGLVLTGLGLQDTATSPATILALSLTGVVCLIAAGIWQVFLCFAAARAIRQRGSVSEAF